MLILLLFATQVFTFGYDSGPDQGVCGRKYRSSRVLKPPCDLTSQMFCAKAGGSYPWNAVRHFVRENQGLMKRMYGDQLQRSIIETEMLSNDISSYDDFPDGDNSDLYDNGDTVKTRYGKNVEFDNELQQSDENTARLMGDESQIEDVINTKFVFPEKSVKYGDLMNKSRDKMSERDKESDSPLAEDGYNQTFYGIEESSTNTTENSAEKTTTVTVGTTDATTEDTTVYADEEEVPTTEPERRKSSTGTVLFQDTNQKKVYNYKGQGVNACPVKQEVVAPYWANNTRGQVLALINIYPFEQYIHCEICSFQHKQMYCRDGCRCEQQYRIHRLLAYDPNNECRGVFADWFKFPSCCVCKCYFFNEGRVTARSPRSKEDKYIPNWFKKKNKGYYND